MDTDFYEVEVVHFTNPYFIWVQVKNPDGEAHFEQIGVYGVLPLKMTMDMAENSIVAQRGTEWVPAASLLMEESFAKAVELLFCPVLDRLNSIFDDHKYKFGEIIMKQSDGEIILLSEALEQSSFATYDNLDFETQLNSGKIKTKLPLDDIKEVANILKQVNEEQAHKQLEIFYTAQQFQSTLTVRNLQAHNKRTKNTISLEESLKNKLEDLEICKNIAMDEEPLGRASSRQSDSSNRTSSLILKKRLALSKPKLTEENLKYFTDRYSEPRSDAVCDRKDIAQDKRADLKVNSSEVKPKYDIKPKKYTNKELSSTTKACHDIDWDEDNFQSDNQNEVQQILKKKKSTKHPKAHKMPEYNPNTETRVAYGPPDTDRTKLTMKVIPKSEFIQRSVPFVHKKEETHQKKTEDAFGDVDSECEELVLPKKVTVDVDEGINLTGGIKSVFSPQSERLVGIMEKIRNKVRSNSTLKESTDKIECNSPSNFVGPYENESDIYAKKSSLLDIKYKGNFRENLKAAINKEETYAHESTAKVNVKRNFDNVRQTLQKNNHNNNIIDSDTTGTSVNVLPITTHCRNSSNVLLKRKQLLKKRLNSSASDTSNKDSTTSIEDEVRKSDKISPSAPIKANIPGTTSPDKDPSDDERVLNIIEKLNEDYKPLLRPKQEEIVTNVSQIKNNVNPFKNVDPNISVFVDKLVTPVLMVHSKIEKRFLPTFKLRDIPFTTHIQVVLKNIGIDTPMTIQKISWGAVLRGYSTFLISPKNSGKTLGYLPAVCRLVADHDSGIDGTGPSSIIVCATSNSVSEVEKLAKIFLESKERVLAFYPSMSELDITTSLLNGCDLMICTPPILVRLLQLDLGVNLQRLTTFVLDDCERLSEVYMNEIIFFISKIKHMLKNRVVKEVKVQFIVASRVWCDFMEPLARKAPDTVICIGAFQECVLYSKANTTASFVDKENKVKSVIEFLKQIDTSKRTVIVCRTDDEVKMLELALVKEKYVVFACDSAMTVEDLYKLQGSWDEYHEPLKGPVLLCCDGNLTHLNVTDAHYLVHYSLPNLFSAFCKRFSVVNDNYASIFRTDRENVKIKILLDVSNIEQLPKILHFIKRCTKEVPEVLDNICEKVLVEKDQVKGKKMVPICDNLLALGECPDFWNCQERHAVIKEYDEPKDWVPKDGIITFQIIHYHTAILYSVRLLSNVTNEKTVKYPQTYKMLAMKLARYFGNESNRKLLGVPKVGDICAVALADNNFMRCQVIKILSQYPKGNPNHVLVRILDQERLEKTRDIYLYYLPEATKTVETHTLQVRLGNIQPKEKDITFSDLAKNQLKKLTETDDELYLRAKVGLSVGNCIFVETLETYRDLSSMNKTVFRHDFKQELLEKHAINNPEHLPRLRKLCQDAGLSIKEQKTPPAVAPPVKTLPKEQWAHLEKDDLSLVYFTTALDPSTFFVRLVKFENPCHALVNDIQKYVKQNHEKRPTVFEGSIVLARLPDDGLYDRARVDKIINDDKVQCFFVDHGDWRDVSREHLLEIPDNFITQLPFQAIECRLVSVQPPGQHWTEFATNWFTNCLHDNNGDPKQINVKYFTKEQAIYTRGHKYGVVLIDTNSDRDIIINDLIMQVNLGQQKESEIDYLDQLDFGRVRNEKKDKDGFVKWENVSKSSLDTEPSKSPSKDLVLQKPIRSVPLVESDCDSGSENKWDSNFDQDFLKMLFPTQQQNDSKFSGSSTQAIKNELQSSTVEMSRKLADVNLLSTKDDSTGSEASFTQKVSSFSDMEIIPSSNIEIRELDSDDLTSPDTTQVSIKFNDPDESLQLTERKAKKSIDYDSLRKPKVCWRQNKQTVSMKIMLIGAEKYDLNVQGRSLNFFALCNDTTYGFNIELYGLIDTNNISHSDKGQYILVTLSKVLDRNWLTLTRSGIKHKWIVNDVDAIDVSSDEEDEDELVSANVIKNLCNNETESEDDDMVDDSNFAYSR